MEERKVSVEGVTREVPDPFLVIATQNPFGSAGTQLLPGSQMDRFMTALSLGYPGAEEELTMAQTVGEGSRTDTVTPVFGCEDLRSMRHQIPSIYMKEEVARYLVELIRETRNHPHLERGASPRATIALVKMSKSAAWYDGRFYVTPQDVAGQFIYTAAHRVSLNESARMANRTLPQVLGEILEKVKRPVPREGGRAK